MGNNLQSVGVTLNPKTVEAVDVLARSRGVSRSEAIRIAVDVGLPMMQLGIAINAERALTILEHTQLALSLLVEKQSAEEANDIITQAIANVREYHG